VRLGKMTLTQAATAAAEFHLLALNCVLKVPLNELVSALFVVASELGF